MGDNRLQEEILKAKCTYKYILTGINKEEPDTADYFIRDAFYLLIFDKYTCEVDIGKNTSWSNAQKIYTLLQDHSSI
jgi:hypothetical protein